MNPVSAGASVLANLSEAGRCSHSFRINRHPGAEQKQIVRDDACWLVRDATSRVSGLAGSRAGADEGLKRRAELSAKLPEGECVAIGSRAREVGRLVSVEINIG